MARKNLIEILIRADDKASKKFHAVSGSANMLNGVMIGLAGTLASGAVAAGIGKIVRESIDLNREMANVATLIPGNIPKVEQYRSVIQKMSIDVVKSTGDLSRGMYQVISAYGDIPEATKILNISARAATAGISETTDAINLISAVTKGYGNISAEAAQQASDLAFMTVKLGQTTFPELAASIGRVVPTAAALRVEQEELFNVFGTFTGVTGDAALVTTQLNSILNALIKPTDAMTAAINGLGFATARAMVDELGLIGTLGALHSQTDGTQEEMGKLFENVRALPMVFAATGGQADTYRKKLALMQETAGASNVAFDEQTKGVNKLGVEFDRLKLKMTVLAQGMGEELAPAAGKIADVLNEIAESGEAAQLPLTVLSFLIVKYIEWAEWSAARNDRAMNRIKDGWKAVGREIKNVYEVFTLKDEAGERFAEARGKALDSLKAKAEDAAAAAGGLGLISQYLAEANEELRKMGLLTDEIEIPKPPAPDTSRADQIKREEAELKKVIALAEKRFAIEEERRARAREIDTGWTVEYPDIDIGPLPDFSAVIGPATLDTEQLRDRLGEAAAEAENLSDALEDVPDLITRAGEEAGRTAEQIRRMFEYSGTDVLADLNNSFGNAMGIMFSTAQNKTQAIERVFENMVSQIIASLAKMAMWKFIILPLLGLQGGGEYIGAQKGLEFVGAQEGVQWNFAQSGLEAVGGQFHRDTIPVAIGRGEVVSPAPHVERVERFMKETERTKGGDVYFITPFVTGSMEERLQFGEYTERRLNDYGKFVVEGTL